ncbi:MAG: MASE1 domain-containing protein [Patescibacteria group bacterium]
MKKDANQFSKGFISKINLVYFVKLVLLFTIYYVTAKLGLKFDAVSGFATLVWPPTGIAIAGILFLGYKFWPAIFIGAFFVNFSTGAPVLVALGIGLGNMLEAVIGIFLIRKFGFTEEKEGLKNTLLFIFFCVLINTILAATIGVTSLWLGGIVSYATYTSTWLAWWVGDALGALIVGNLIISFGTGLSKLNLELTKITEEVLFFCILVISNLFIFTDFLSMKTIGLNNPILVYIIFPLLIWASLRFGRSGAALAVFVTSIISIWGTVLRQGPFGIGELSHNLLLLQGYIGVIAGTSMILSAVIEERSETESELINERNKDEAILESIGEGVVVIDTNGIILMINRAAQIMLGVEPNNAIGHYYGKIVHIEDKKGVPLPVEKRPFTLALSSNKVITDNYYFRPHNNKKFPVTMNTAPIIFEQKVVGVIDVFRDITHEIEVDKAKSEFVSLASHQLRTPLTTIKWYSHALLGEDGENLSQKQLEYVQEMYHNNERMIELVNSLLNVSRIELGRFLINPVSIDVREIANEIIHDMKPYAESKNITIQKQYDPNIPPALADPNLMKIILQNLLTNSIKYSEKHTAIHFRIKNKDEEILFIISDMGCGISKDQQDKIFTKMFRTENARTIDPEGSGLGLYIVKSIVEQSGGRIWFTSEVNKGSTFYVALPLRGMRKRGPGSRLIYK